MPAVLPWTSLATAAQFPLFVGSPGHDVAGHQSVARANGKQAVDGIVLRSVVGNGEPVHASEMHTVDGEPADGEAADREALQHSGLRPAAGRVLVIGPRQ